MPHGAKCFTKKSWKEILSKLSTDIAFLWMGKFINKKIKYKFYELKSEISWIIKIF